MPSKKTKYIRIALIITGICCIAVVVVREALQYPWAILFRAKTELAYKPPPMDATGEVPIPIRAEILDELRAESATGEESAAGTESSTLPLEDTDLSMNEMIEFGEEKSIVEIEGGQDEIRYLGEVSIPVLDVNEQVLEGTTNREMYIGVGHLEGTAMPGKYGNCVLSAHRVSMSGMEPFKYLDLMQNGDTVTVTYNEQEYVYEVFDSFIVTLSDDWVLYPDWDDPKMLTLLTCDPLIYPGGNRPNRLIVRARLMS